MVWTAPMTAVANTIFTAAQFNTFVRDNLNETAPAKLTAGSRYIVSTGMNAITQRECFNDTVATSESTASTSFTDLATLGPGVSTFTGTKALVSIACRFQSDTVNSAVVAGFEVSGASSIPAADAMSVILDGVAANNSLRYGITTLSTGLTPGLNTFIMKYRVGSAIGTFSLREIVVFPF